MKIRQMRTTTSQTLLYVSNVVDQITFQNSVLKRILMTSSVMLISIVITIVDYNNRWENAIHKHIYYLNIAIPSISISVGHCPFYQGKNLE